MLKAEGFSACALRLRNGAMLYCSRPKVLRTSNMKLREGDKTFCAVLKKAGNAIKRLAALIKLPSSALQV